ncbi:MAG: hypothetical protein F6K17_41130 [Okeania sp. SIO3C4]|nr:hypothetical protein [Okeania sp. SIO3C4]
MRSNGLIVYESDDDKVTELYRQFFQELKSGGIFVTSFMTPSPDLDPNSERDMNQLNQDYILLSKIIFTDILNSKLKGFRSSSTKKLQLQTVGFDEIELIWDNSRIYLTVVANKPK